MNDTLMRVTEIVLQKARLQGYTVPEEVRAVLADAGLPPDLCPDVLALARSSLRYAEGRYLYQAPLSDRATLEKERVDAVLMAIRKIIQQQQERAIERRSQERIDWIHPVVLLLDEEQREHHVLSRDLSVTGIRLIGTRHLLGQTVRLRWPRPDSPAPWVFRVRIVWSCAVGDDLYENGGSFVGLES